jgi:exopolysaccharide biosynthesis polyprenyl glycosylphosphotransferase
MYRFTSARSGPRQRRRPCVAGQALGAGEVSNRSGALHRLLLPCIWGSPKIIRPLSGTKVFAHRSKLLGVIWSLHDLVMSVLAIPVAYSIWPKLFPFSARGWFDLESASQSYWPLLVGFGFLTPVLGYLLGFYREVQSRDRVQVAKDLSTLAVLVLILNSFGLNFLGIGHVSWSLGVTIGFVDFGLLGAGRWLLFSLTLLAWNNVGNLQYFLIVGTGPESIGLANLIERSKGLGVRLVGFVAERMPIVLPAGLEYAYPAFPAGELRAVLHKNVVDEILLAVPPDELTRLKSLLDCCHEEGVKVRILPNSSQPGLLHGDAERFKDVPLRTLGRSSPKESHLAIKRTLDIFISSVALLLLSPLLLLLALLIRLTSPGPILYRQTRCGLAGRRFTLFKFRTMVANAQALRVDLEALNEMDGPVFKITDDPRCTPLGRLLRKFSLDELPQLWNVLRGDMSLVGPRPPLPEEVDRYEPWQRRRLRARPGLTCLWVLEGRSRLNFRQWVELDLHYIENWSLGLDLRILLRTIPIVLLARGAS